MQYPDYLNNNTAINTLNLQNSNCQ